MAQRARSPFRRYVPWERTIGWGTVMFEGVASLILGLTCFMWIEQARWLVLLIVGAWLLIKGGITLVGVWSTPDVKDVPRWSAMVVGITGVVIGLIAMLQPFFSFLSEGATRIMLGIGFLIFGLIGLYQFYITPKDEFSWRGGLLTSLINIVLAILLFFLSSTNGLLFWFGWFAIIAGVLLIIYAVGLRRARMAMAQRIPSQMQ